MHLRISVSASLYPPTMITTGAPPAATKQLLFLEKIRSVFRRMTYDIPIHVNGFSVLLMSSGECF
jgi:hypothetical protein